MHLKPYMVLSVGGS